MRNHKIVYGTLTILLLIGVILISGCTTPQPTFPSGQTIMTATPKQTHSVTPALTLQPTQTPIITKTPQQVKTPITTLNPEVHWCAVKSECDSGVRALNTEACINANRIPKRDMDQYCKNDPIKSIQQTAEISREYLKCLQGMQPDYETCDYWENQI